MLSSSASRLLRRLPIVILATLLLADLAQTKFFSADLKWTRRRGPRLDQADLTTELADLLTVRNLDEDPLLEKAMHVIDSVSTRSTCHQAAAAQLLLTCRAVGKDISAEEGKHELLERAKSVYAVRLSVCETGEGRAAIPATCKPILIIPRQLNSEFEVVNSRSLPPCLEALIAEHYYWTSYSNSRQDANTLCQAVTLEAAKLEALHSYQRLAELLPEFRNDLLSTRAQWLLFLKQQEQSAEELGDLQAKNREEIRKQHEKDLTALHSAMSVAKDRLEDASQAMRQSVASAGSDIGRSREAIAQVLADFASLRILLNEATETASKMNTENIAMQAAEMAKIHDLAIVTSEALKDTKAQEVMLDINELFQEMKTEIDYALRAQATQLSNTQLQLRLSEELTETQKASLSWGQQLKDTSADLVSELDSAAKVAGQMSHRLEHVDLALTRVERASAVLSTLFALIALPARLAAVLHLRLFGVFAMPTALLYFCKPTKYSYMLISIYISTECLISLVVEYKVAILSAIVQMKDQSRSLLNWALRSLMKNMPFLALVSIFSIACFTLAAVCGRKHKVTPDPQMARKTKHLRPEKCCLVEHRLHNGKNWQSSAERFRRAATVC